MVDKPLDHPPANREYYMDTKFGEEWRRDFPHWKPLTFESIEKRENKLEWKGVPTLYRANHWFYSSGAHLKQWTSEKGYAAYKEEAMKGEHADYKEIEKDILRSMPEHPYFRDNDGKEGLRHVLNAYSLRNPTVGYCQGMVCLLFPSPLSFSELCDRHAVVVSP